MNLDNLAFVDIETTGTSITKDRIIEISIIRIENNKRIQTFSSLVNPEIALPPYITTITGIERNELLNAPTFSSIRTQVRRLLKDCIFVAHNARFDYSFLKSEFHRIDETFSAETLCTVKLFSQLYPEAGHFNLDSLISYFQLTCKHRHRAYDDAKVLLDFYRILRKIHSKEKLDGILGHLLKKSYLPAHITLKDIDILPESPGVYIFYGKEETPLYVGKSKNLKSRVLSHFSNSINSDKEMTLQHKTQAIKTIDTSGELSALLLESALVKKLNPIHNRKLRVKHLLYLAKRYVNDAGYYTVTIKKAEQVDIQEIDDILGIFRSLKQAIDNLSAIAKQYNLCSKLLGTEKTNGACFLSQIDICKGACVGREAVLSYNIRFVEAFSLLKIRQWPFDGPVVITEIHPEKKLQQKIIVDRWCVIGTEYAVDQERTNEETSIYNFDIDTYHILVDYIFNIKNSVSIKVLKNMPRVK